MYLPQLQQQTARREKCITLGGHGDGYFPKPGFSGTGIDLIEAFKNINQFQGFFI